MGNSIYDLEYKSIQPGFQTLKAGPIKPITIKKEPWTKSIEDHKTEVEALKSIDKELNQSSSKAPGIIGMASIASGAASLINAGASLYGAIQAGKMQPSLLKPYVPIEAKLIADNSSAIKAAGEENIAKSIATNRADATRKGIAGMNGVFVAKETEALNQLSGQLAQYRTDINTKNAQIENDVNAQNKQTEMQTELANAQLKERHTNMQSGLIGMSMKNTTDAITGMGGIFGNMIAGKQNEISSITSELSQINNLMTNNPKWTTTPGIVPADVLDRKKKLETRLDELKILMS